MANDWTEEKMQNALTRRGNLFDFTVYAVVPNVSYAVLGHGEADLLCLSKSNTFHEVEIKVSKSDMKADLKKHRGHENSMVAYTWFAVPDVLEDDALEIVPSRYGLVVVESDPHRFTCYRTRVVRKATKYTGFGARKPTDAEVLRFLRTGVIRMWSRRNGDA